MESRKMAPKEKTQVNVGQLMHAAYVFAIWYGRSISWSIDSCHNKVSTDQYRMTVSRAQLENSPRSRVFFLKFTADQIIKTSQKMEAPLLGLAKSIYYP